MKRKIEAVVIFFLFFLIVFYLVNFNFRKFENKVVTVNDKIPSAWLDKYGLIVLDEKDLSTDYDQDGLGLLEEYEYQTDPSKADTDDDGYSDGKEVGNGYSPIGEGKMDYDGDGLPDKWEKENGLDTKINDYNTDSDGDELLNYLEYAHLTNPVKADTDSDGFSDLEEIRNGYDPSAPGEVRPDVRIRISKIGVDAPVIFSSSFLEKSLQEDLTHGVIRYPETSAPGQEGNMVISGHSSNYAWLKGDYNYVFAKNGDLAIGDSIVVDVTQKNGQKFEYEYVVFEKEVMSPSDSRIFDESSEKELTLTTCWPLGTDWNRLVVKARMR